MASVESKGSKPRPWERDAAGEAASFGGWLRRQREMREVGLREIADATKISLRYLEALEQDEFDVLPAPVFAKGFLREYARYVGLDPDEVVNSYLNAQQRLHDLEEEQARAAHRTRPRRGWRSWGLALAALGVAGLVVAGIAYLRRAPGAPAVSPATPPDAAVEPPGSAPGPADGADLGAAEAEPEGAAGSAAAGEELAPLRLSLEFLENCWVEATVDGRPRLGELRAQGETLQLEGREGIDLRLGNAAGVRAELNGRPFALPGPAEPGRPVQLRIDLAAAGLAPAEGAE